MIRQVNLLVCVNASVNPESIDEMDLYAVLSSVVQPADVKIISRESMVKAFVRVNEDEVETLMDAFHGRLLKFGRMKMFLSHKQYISYDKPPKDMIAGHADSQCGGIAHAEVNNQADKGFINKNVKPNTNSGCGCGGINKKENCTLIESVLYKKNKNIDRDELPSLLVRGPSGDIEQSSLEHRASANCDIDNSGSLLQSQPVPFEVGVTHENVKFLEKGKISKIFRKIGRVIYITEDLGGYRVVGYRSENEVLRAINAIKNGQFFGYKLHGTNSHFINRHDENSSPVFNHRAQEPLVMLNTVSSSNNTGPVTLRLVAPQGTSIENVCRLVSRIVMPLEIVEAMQPQTKQCFYLVSFRHCHQAAEAFARLSLLANENSSFDVTFEQSIN